MVIFVSAIKFRSLNKGDLKTTAEILIIAAEDSEALKTNSVKSDIHHGNAADFCWMRGKKGKSMSRVISARENLA